MQAKEPNVETLQLTPPEVKVARVNRKLVVTLLCALGAVVAISLVVGLQPSKVQKEEKEEASNVPSTVVMPERFAELPGSYAEARVQQKKAGMQGQPSMAELSPSSGQGMDREIGQQAREEKAREQREQQEEEQALRSKLTISLAHAENTTPSAGSKQDAGALTTNTQPVTPGETPVDPDTVQNMQQAKRDFVKNNGDSSVYLTRTLQAPLSEYQVNAGTLIPASLITGINSDLPGQIVAQVRENVYDTVTGNILLIPQGTRLIGQYDSLVAYGQNRILLIWDKLVMPNGNTITLDSMAGTDLQGYAGLKDGVDYHTMRLVGSVLVSSLLSVGITETQADRNSTAQQFSQNVAEDINKAGQEIVRKNLNIQPTITIRPGYSLNVFVNKHMVLAPYQENQ